MSGPSRIGASTSGYQYSKLNNDDGGFVESTLQKQQMLINEQDEHLEKVGESTRVLRDMSARIGDELDEQSIMLDDLRREIDRTETRLDNVLRKVAKVMHMSDDDTQCKTIIVLTLILSVVVLIWLII